MNLKLKIELVPSSSWYNNLRKILSASEWDKIRREQYKKSSYKCDICGGKGRNHPVECHEVWSYDDEKCIQYLDGLTSLCPNCHEVKHIGLASTRGRYQDAKIHFMKVNGIKDANHAEMLIDDAFYQYRERSEKEWTVVSRVDEISIPRN